MIINSTLNNYSKQSTNSINTELNDSLSQLYHEQGRGKIKNEHSEIVVSDNLYFNSNEISSNIKQANENIIITQIANLALSEQSNILNEVDTKLSRIKNGLPNISEAFAVAKEIQKLMANLEFIASKTTYKGEYLLQSSSTDKSRNLNLIYQLGNFIDESIIDHESFIAANLDKEGYAKGSLSELKEDENLFTQILEQARSFDDAGDLESSQKSKENIKDYITVKRMDIETANEDLLKLKEQFSNIQSALEESIKRMTGENKLDTEQYLLSNIDYALESISFDKSNILSYAGSFKLSQANMVTKKSMNLL